MFKHEINKDKYFDIKLSFKPCFKVLAKSTYKGSIDNKHEIKFFLHKNFELFPIRKDINLKNSVFPTVLEYYTDQFKRTRKYPNTTLNIGGKSLDLNILENGDIVRGGIILGNIKYPYEGYDDNAFDDI